MNRWATRPISIRWAISDIAATALLNDPARIAKEVNRSQAQHDDLLQEVLAARALWTISKVLLRRGDAAITGVGGVPPRLVERAVAWFEAEMHRGVTASDVARGMSVSRSTLSRRIRAETGRSVHDNPRGRTVARGRAGCSSKPPSRFTRWPWRADIWTPERFLVPIAGAAAFHRVRRGDK